MSKTLDDKEQFIELRARGYSFNRISRKLKISKPKLIAWSKEEKTRRFIHNLSTLNIDELHEKYAMTRRHRLEAFGELLNNMKAELNNRDLTTVSTDRLINLVMKISDTLKQDEEELELQGEPSLLIELGPETPTWRV